MAKISFAVLLLLLLISGAGLEVIQGIYLGKKFLAKQVSTGTGTDDDEDDGWVNSDDDDDENTQMDDYAGDYSQCYSSAGNCNEDGDCSPDGANPACTCSKGKCHSKTE